MQPGHHRIFHFTSESLSPDDAAVANFSPFNNCITTLALLSVFPHLHTIHINTPAFLLGALGGIAHDESIQRADFDWPAQERKYVEDWFDELPSLRRVWIEHLQGYDLLPTYPHLHARFDANEFRSPYFGRCFYVIRSSDNHLHWQTAIRKEDLSGWEYTRPLDEYPSVYEIDPFFSSHFYLIPPPPLLPPYPDSELNVLQASGDLVDIAPSTFKPFMNVTYPVARK